MKAAAAPRKTTTPRKVERNGAERKSRDVAAFLRLVRNRRGGGQAYVELLGLEVSDPMLLLERVGKGLRYEAFERLRHNAGFTAAELAIIKGLVAMGDWPVYCPVSSKVLSNEITTGPGSLTITFKSARGNPVVLGFNVFDIRSYVGAG